MERNIPRVSTLYSGTGQPYVALFTENLDPLLNTVNDLPLGYYVSKFSYQMSHDKENVCQIDIDAGITEILDIPEVQEGNILKMQYGYVFSDGSVKSSKLYTLKIKEVSITLDDRGTHMSLKLKDSVSDLRHIDGYMESGDGKTFLDYLEEGLYNNTGIKIVQFFQVTGNSSTSFRFSRYLSSILHSKGLKYYRNFRSLTLSKNPEDKKDVFLSIQEPISKIFSGYSKVLYANKYIAGGPIACTDELLKQVLNSSTGNTGNNVLIQLKQKMDFYKNGPWYIDSINGIVYIHNRIFQRDSSYVYTYAGEPGEVLSVTFRMVDVFKNNIAGIIGAIDQYTKDVTNALTYTLELKLRNFENISEAESDTALVQRDNTSTVYAGGNPITGNVNRDREINLLLEIDSINEETYKKDPANQEYWAKARKEYNSQSKEDKRTYNERSSDEALANANKEDLIKELLEKNPALYKCYEQMVYFLSTAGENDPQYKSLKKEFDKLLAEAETSGVRVKTSKEVAAFRMYTANLTTKAVRVLKPELKLYDTENYSDEFLAAYISSGLRQKAMDEAIKSFQSSNYDSIDHSSIKILPNSIKDNQVGNPEYSAYHSTGDLYIQSVKYKTTFQIAYYGFRSAQGYTSLTKAYRSLLNGVNSPSSSLNDAAANLGKKLREKQLQAELKVVGNPALESSDQIILQNVGKKYSGVWYINSIVHSFEPGQGYISIIQLTKQLSKAETLSQNINLNTQAFTGTNTEGGSTDNDGRPTSTVKNTNKHYDVNSTLLVASTAELSTLEFVLSDTKDKYKNNPDIGSEENRKTINGFASQIYLKNLINRDHPGAISDLVSYNSESKKFETDHNKTVEIQAKEKGIDIKPYEPLVQSKKIKLSNGFLFKLSIEYVGPDKSDKPSK